MRQLPTHTDDPAPSRAACHDCPGPERPDRRRLLRDALVAATTALVSLGASGSAAAALPLRALTAARPRGDQVRYPIPTADGASIDRENEVILVRWQNAVYAFNLACPHQHVALRWLEGDGGGRFQCPKHKSKYRPDGTFIEGRATRGLDRFALARDGASVAVDLSTPYEQHANAAAWSGAVLRLA